MKSGSFKRLPCKNIYNSNKNLENLSDNKYSKFEEAFKSILYKHVLIKTRLLRHINNP